MTIQENTTRAALIALNRAIDAFYEAEAKHPLAGAVRLLHAYGNQTADTTTVLNRKAIVAQATQKAKQAVAEAEHAREQQS